MTHRIAITGWRVDFRKIANSRHLQTELGYSLSNAKTVTDAILDGKTVRLELPDENARQLFSKLDELGAVLHWEDE